ncbi:hypothetical protein Gotur_025475, partial [Gossypium turneri]
MNKILAIHAILVYFDSVMTPNDFEMFSFIVMDPERAVIDEVESNVPTPAEGTVPPDVNVSERPISVSQGGGAREAFFQDMNDFRMNLAVRPPLPHDSQVPHVAFPAAGIVIRESHQLIRSENKGLNNFGL